MFNGDYDINAQVPNEVYFAEFIPAFFPITVASELESYARTHNINEPTYLYFKYTHTHLTSFADRYITNDRNYKIRISFIYSINTAFAAGLGYTVGDVLVKYPCKITGTMVPNPE